MTMTKNIGYYIVDPGGDFKYTKETFEAFFEKKNGTDGKELLVDLHLKLNSRKRLWSLLYFCKFIFLF